MTDGIKWDDAPGGDIQWGDAPAGPTLAAQNPPEAQATGRGLSNALLSGALGQPEQDRDPFGTAVQKAGAQQVASTVKGVGGQMQAVGEIYDEMLARVQGMGTSEDVVAEAYRQKTNARAPAGELTSAGRGLYRQAQLASGAAAPSSANPSWENLAASTIMAPVGLAPILATGPFAPATAGVLSAGEAYGEARNEKGAGIPAALQYAGASGGGSGALMAIPASRLFKAAGAELVTELKNAGVNMAQFGGIAGLQSLYDAGLRHGFFNDQTPLSDVLKQAGEAVVEGAAGALPFEAPKVVHAARGERAAKKPAPAEPAKTSLLRDDLPQPATAEPDVEHVTMESKHEDIPTPPIEKVPTEGIKLGETKAPKAIEIPEVKEPPTEAEPKVEQAKPAEAEHVGGIPPVVERMSMEDALKQVKERTEAGENVRMAPLGDDQFTVEETPPPKVGESDALTHEQAREEWARRNNTMGHAADESPYDIAPHPENADGYIVKRKDETPQEALDKQRGYPSLMDHPDIDQAELEQRFKNLGIPFDQPHIDAVSAVTQALHADPVPTIDAATEHRNDPDAFVNTAKEIAHEVRKPESAKPAKAAGGKKSKTAGAESKPAKAAGGGAVVEQPAGPVKAGDAAVAGQPAQPVRTVETSVGPRKVESAHDVPLLAGENKAHDTVSFDKDFNPVTDKVKAPDGKPYDRTRALAEHEAVEAKHEAEGDPYLTAHHKAEKAERKVVEADGVNWDDYQKSYDDEIKKAAAKKGGTAPPDLVDKPYEHPHNQRAREALGEVERAEPEKQNATEQGERKEGVRSEREKGDEGGQAAEAGTGDRLRPAAPAEGQEPVNERQAAPGETSETAFSRVPEFASGADEAKGVFVEGDVRDVAIGKLVDAINSARAEDGEAPVPDTDFRAAELSPRDKPAIAMMARLFKLKVVTFTQPENATFSIDGCVIRGGTIYLRTDTQRPHLAVAAHEMLHSLKRELPAEYEKLAAAIGKMGRDLEAYRTANRMGALDEGVVHEEMIADLVGDHMLDPDFWHQLAGRLEGEEKGLAVKIYTYVQSQLAKLLDAFRHADLGSRRYFNDFDQLQRHVLDATEAYARSVPAEGDEDLAFKKRDLKTEVPGLSRVLPHLTEQERSALRVDTAQRMVDVFNELPASAREVAAVALAGQVKRGWYRKSAQAIVDQYGVEAPRFTALLSSLSPQTSVETNLSNTIKVWDAWNKAGRPTDRDEIVKLMSDVLPRGAAKVGSGNVLHSWINNTVRALSAAGPHALMLSGPKVDSFMRNLREDVNAVTNDAWAATYHNVDPASLGGTASAVGPGKSPTYLAVTARTREAAKLLTKLTGEKWTPEEIQETTWSWAKALYEKADAVGESRSAKQIIADRDLADALINSVPDFHNLLKGAHGNEAIATEAAGGVGEAARRSSGRKAIPFEEAAYQRLLERAAARLDAVREQRRGPAAREPEEFADSDANFRRRAPREQVDLDRGRGQLEPAVSRGAREGAVDLKATHYSPVARTELDGRKHGTGAPGAERTRLGQTADGRIKQRVYAYVDEGNGIKPEREVGQQAHSVQFSNLYALHEDPLGLAAKAVKKAKTTGENANSVYESAILNAGFDGWYDKGAQDHQGVAVVLGKASHAVRATPVETPVRQGAPAFLRRPVQLPAAQQAALSQGLDPQNRELMQAVGRGAIDHAYAVLARVTASAERALATYRDHYDRMLATPNGQQEIRDAVHQFETGQQVTQPHLAQFFGMMKAAFDQRVAAVVASGRQMGYIENYFPHLYKDEKKAGEWFQQYAARNPIEGGKGWTKERFYKTLEDARAAGLETVSENPADMMQAHLHQLDKFVAMHQITSDLEKRGLVMKDNPDAFRKPEGWATVNDPAFRGKLVPEVIAKDLNTVLGPSLNSSAAFRVFRKVENGMVSAALGLSGFHATMTTGDTIAAHIADGIQRASIGDIGGAVKSFGSAAVSPLVSPIAGHKLLRQSMGELPADPQTAAILRSLEQGGHQAKMSATELNDSAVKLMRLIRQGEWRKSIKGAGMTAWEGAHALFENITPLIHKYLVPSQKMTAKVLAMKFELDALAGKLGQQRGDYAGITAAMSEDAIRQVAGKVVSQVDDRLGQMNYRRLYMNRYTRDVLQAAFMSPGWQIGTLRTLGGGLADVRKIATGGDTIQGKLDAGGTITNAQMHRLSGRTAYLVALHALVGGIATGITYLLSGQEPGDDVRNYYTIRTGRKNNDGTDERLAFPSYLKDEVELAHGGVTAVPGNLAQMGKNKLNPVFRALGDLGSNKDFYGNQIYNEDADRATQAKQVGLHLATMLEPFAVAGAVKANEAGKSAGMVAANTMGINPAPSYMTRSPFQDFVHERYPRQLPAGSRTPEDADKATQIRQAMDAVRAGVEPDLTAFSPKQQANILRATQTDPIEYKFKKLPLKEKVLGYEKASPQEREKYNLAQHVYEGLHAISSMDPAEQEWVNAQLEHIE